MSAVPDTLAALRLVDESPGIHLDAAEQAVSALLLALGVDLDDEHVRATPGRVARAYAELLSPQPFELTTFENDDDYHELVLVADIPFQSLCAHHLLPFHGVAHVGYLPAERIVGLSKLARVVEWFARGLQVQERLTQLIADCLDAHLAPLGVGVVLEAEHQCMALRGARVSGTRTTTSALRGAVRDDPAQRAEFVSRARSGRL